MVLLDRLIENLSVRVEPFAMCEVGGSQPLTLGSDDWSSMHFCLAGSGSLHVPGHGAVEITPYSLVLVPPGVSQLIHASGDGDHLACSLHVPGLQHHATGTAGEPDLILACGRVRAVYARGLDLFGMLSEPLLVQLDETMGAILDRMLDESSEGSPGSRAMLAALMNQCLVLLLRRLCEGPDCALPWLAALDDPAMAAALSAILDDPGQPHSVESLAATAHMSRSAFAAEFAKSFNTTPMSFVRTSRLRHAADLLRSTDLSVDAVASRVGYASRSHFSRAFVDEFGRNPSEFRASVGV